MEEVIYYSNLFDYYGSLLSIKEQKYFKEYYFENLSLQEIADNSNISKNAVSKSVKEAKNKLDYYESVLKLLDNNHKIKKLVSEETYDIISKYI